ncbi:MAG: hypothetical protein AB7F79_02375 [Steroidobacteraceae bacterium]
MSTPDQYHGDTARDKALEQRSRALFNEQVANLDGHTRSRLNQARQAALAAARGDSREEGKLASMRWLVPTGSVAVLALVGMVSWQLLRPVDVATTSEPQLVAVSTVDDLEIMTANTELELLQNMDFYVWLDSRPGSLTMAEKG